MHGADTTSHRPQSTSAGPGPRWRFGAWLFRNETLAELEFLLDEAFRLPGTGIRFGFDGIVGLIPGIGDVLAGLLSLLIPIAAGAAAPLGVRMNPMLAGVAMGLSSIFVLSNSLRLKRLQAFRAEPGAEPAVEPGLEPEAASGEGILSWRDR